VNDQQTDLNLQFFLSFFHTTIVKNRQGELANVPDYLNAPNEFSPVGHDPVPVPELCPTKRKGGSL